MRIPEGTSHLPTTAPPVEGIVDVLKVSMTIGGFEVDYSYLLFLYIAMDGPKTELLISHAECLLCCKLLVFAIEDIWGSLPIMTGRVVLKIMLIWYLSPTQYIYIITNQSIALTDEACKRK
jgi:hypothetical protein